MARRHFFALGFVILAAIAGGALFYKSRQSEMISIPDLSKKVRQPLSAPSNVNSLNLEIKGSVAGTGEVWLLVGTPPNEKIVKTFSVKGAVNLHTVQDWYTTTGTLEYFPNGPAKGWLEIKYKFQTQ